MTDHIKTRQRLKAVTIMSEFESLLQACMLTEDERQIMRLHYMDGMNLACIGDILGYSESSIKRKHREILRKLKV